MQPCEIPVHVEKRFQLVQHIKTSKHQSNAVKYDKKKKTVQLTMAEARNVTRNTFSEELCIALLAADIPFFKLKNPTLRIFLEKNIKQNIPDDSTLRKCYLKPAYEKV